MKSIYRVIFIIVLIIIVLATVYKGKEYFKNDSYINNLLQCNTAECHQLIIDKINKLLKTNPLISYTDFKNTFKEDTVDESILSNISEVTFKGLISHYKINNIISLVDVRKYIPF